MEWHCFIRRVWTCLQSFWDCRQATALRSLRTTGACACAQCGLLYTESMGPKFHSLAVATVTRTLMLCLIWCGPIWKPTKNCGPPWTLNSVWKSSGPTPRTAPTKHCGLLCWWHGSKTGHLHKQASLIFYFTPGFNDQLSTIINHYAVMAIVLPNLAAGKIGCGTTLSSVNWSE